MQFTSRLRPGIESGDITTSIRIWQRPRVRVGQRYKLGAGMIEIDALSEIALADITPQMARRSGFNGVVELLKVAKHGRGENVYLVAFHYLSPDALRRESAR